jgi:hypothetical protein
MLSLADVQVLKLPHKMDHICSALPRPAVTMEWPETLADGSPSPPAPFFFVVKFQMSGDNPTCLVLYFVTSMPSNLASILDLANGRSSKGNAKTATPSALFCEDPVFDGLLRKFICGSDKYVGVVHVISCAPVS